MIGFAVEEELYVYALAGGAVLMVFLAWTLRFLERRRRARLYRFAEPATLVRLSIGYAPLLRRPLNPMVVLGVLALLFALAGPQWGEGVGTPSRGSREILVLLDTSESMNAMDPAPSRLVRARDKITALLSRYPGDRFGLIAFSGGAALQCPLTTDHAYFKTILQAVDTDTLSEEGTDIESALNEAEKLFLKLDGQEALQHREDRIVLLISDGEVVSGDAVSAAEKLSAASHVMVIGIGDPDGADVELPKWMRSGRKDIGNTGMHRSRLNEEGLAAIALAGEGVYVRSTLGDEDLSVIERELAFLQGSAAEREPLSQRPNRYRWPLALAFILFCMEGMWLVAMPWLARRHNSAGGEELYS